MRRIRAARGAAILFGAVVAALGAAGAEAQLALDQGVRAGGLWCFPSIDKPLEYHYLPAGVRLATDAGGAPKFSFLRYVVNRPSETGGEASIVTAKGGGVLHFLVELDTPADQVAAAEVALRERTREREVHLRGPVIFSDGRWTLVSSVLRKPGEAGAAREILANGRAPVLEGNQLALSFDLDPDQATLLDASLKLPTPDVSLAFDMTFSGLTDAYDAELTIDWAEAKTSRALSAGGTVYFVSADVELAFEELRRSNAIRLRTSGESAAMEGLLTRVYEKLLELMFRPVEPEAVPADQRGGLVQALSALTGPGGALSSRSTTGFGAYGAFRLKELRSSGTSVLNFNHRANVERHALLVFNVGATGVTSTAVSIDDPQFLQREIRVAIDGELAPEFDRAVNSVTVAMRKRHAGGAETLRELVLDRTSVTGVREPAGSPSPLRMVYGWNGDADREAWLDYDVRTRWSFQGGARYETPWQTRAGAVIDLFAPFERRTVRLAGDPTRLAARGVRALVVEVRYPFFGETRRAQLLWRPGESLEEKSLEITLPRDVFTVQASITWILQDGRRLTKETQENPGIVFVDELPADSGP